MSRPATDALLMTLHWLAAGAVLVSALSGLHIASDDPAALLSVWIRPLTLTGNVHLLHFYSSVVLVGVVAGYVAYLVKTRSFASLHVPRQPARSSRGAWKARNIRIYQLIFALLGALLLTGLLIYTGWQPFGILSLGLVVELHLWSAWALLATVIVHIIAQYQFGAVAGRGAWHRVRLGIDWLLKMLRPAASRAVRRTTAQTHPLTVVAAAAAAFVAGGGYLAVDQVGLRELDTVALGGDAAPVLDGIGDEAVWARAPISTVVTARGANLPDGQSRVEVQAATDGATIYMRFRWEDPTRSYKHLPLQKTPAGWRLLHEQYDIEDEDVFYEDKFAVLLTTWARIGGGVTHMGSKPLANYPGPLSGRGLHYTEDGSLADMWQWKAVRSEPLGGLDDDYFGSPVEPKPEELAGTKRYKGGYVTDPGSIASQNNFKGEGPGGYRGEVLPKFLPGNLDALQARLGPIDLDARVSDSVPFVMTADEVAEYSSEADATIPVGTVIPGVVLGEGGVEGDRGDVATGAHWQDGWWTLEIARALDTGSPLDVAFEPGRAVFMWVAVFDHTQTRHSRHMRPLLIRLPSQTGRVADGAPATSDTQRM